MLTVEDPVEYELAGIGQTQVNAKIDLTFAKALRAILRQDPDVIMIGEIRDYETAQIAIQASLTGHLVLATVHTNDAPSTVTRMIDMGVEPFLLSSSLIGVLAQRLVRKLCLACRKTDARGHWHPVGCAQCAMTGYKGRTGVYELMDVGDEIRNLIHGRAAEAEDRGGRPGGRPEARCARTASAWSRKASPRSKRSSASRASDDEPCACRCAAALPPRGRGRPWAARRPPSRYEMPAYRFEALDASGKAQSGLVDADNSRAARSQLRAQSLVPLAVTQVVSAGTDADAASASRAASSTRPASRSGRASSPAWSARACRSSAR